MNLNVSERVNHEMLAHAENDVLVNYLGEVEELKILYLG